MSPAGPRQHPHTTAPDLADRGVFRGL